ncbi:MAG: GGDEF domain-containing protein, partial [Nitrospirae bacterium]
ERVLSEKTIYMKLKDRFFKVFVLKEKMQARVSYEVYFVDVSELYESQEELTRKNRQIIALNTIITAFLENQEDPYKEIIERLLLVLEFDAGMLVLKKHEELSVVSHKGMAILPEHVKEKWFNEILPKGPDMVIFDEELSGYEYLRREGFEFFSVLPVVIKSEVRGWLCLGTRRPIKPEFDLVTFLNLLKTKLSVLLERQFLYEEVMELSLTDPLTGLRNVRYFYDIIEREVKRATRYGEVFSVAIFDIDDFKYVNDAYGHQVGDDVLKEVAEILKKQSRMADVSARYGGEEFVMLLPKTDKTSALQLAERIRNSVEDRTFCPEAVSISGTAKGLNITISGGVAAFPEDGTTVRELLYKADMALYRAKALGKNRVVLYGGEKK